ncbi:hypothetical protein [Shewanella sp. CG12_big_fil_rev_8_21_14_0_65_47_15]|uniref:hypothetical protein n=1 Tax=Shewanella sp. CG12_big_fil_rev_8_21_14_0_65_47_15 TaxID=1975537 RepID=UPI000CBCFEC4|nr:hypothetical protein [Shewanella sp. CG12_big_fil_rev_8_21_14_0_65_47_15]PIW59290.1 MAG: hypothetical protein COW15_18585 [Shewanella sp. CG12_big_fil_rev_8_21_14_0_65_47_15]
MVISLMAAAALSAVVCGYHLVQGQKMLLAPLLRANVSEQSKQILRCLFHCQSVFFLTSTAIFLICSLKIIPGMYAYSLLLFLGLNYGIFSIWQFYIASLSPPNSSHMLSIQALVFLLISLLAMLGPLLS